jgi:hypothetical protein
MYNFVTIFLNINGLLSVIGSCLIAWSLCYAFVLVKMKREELDKRHADIDQKLILVKSQRQEIDQKLAALGLKDV